MDEALQPGRKLTQHADRATLRSAQWKQGTFVGLPDLGGADLVTGSYVLSELSAAKQAELVARAAEGSDTVAVIEPGTRTDTVGSSPPATC